MRHPLPRGLPAAAAAVLLAGAAPFSTPRTAPTRGAFAVLLGSDTIATERFTRSDDRLEGELTPRGPLAAQQPAFRYDAALRPDASVARFVLTPLGATGSPTAGGGGVQQSATFQGDSVLLVQGADSVRRAAPRGAVPYLNPSPSLLEQIVRRAHALGGTRGDAPVQVPVLVGAGQSTPASVTFPAADSVRIDLANTVVMLRVDNVGAVLGGSVPAQGVTIVRAASAP